MLNEKQRDALEAFIAENEVDLYSLKDEIEWKIEDNRSYSLKAEEERIQREKDALVGKYFFGGEYDIDAYYYVLSARATMNDEVSCLRAFKNPWFGNVRDDSIFLEAIGVDGISYKEFSRFTEISEEEFVEGYMEAIKIVLEKRKML